MLDNLLSDNHNSEIDIVSYLAVLIKYWYIIVIITLLGFCAGIILALREPIIYEAKTTFFLPSVLNESNQSSLSLFDKTTETSKYENYLYMLMASDLFKKAIKKELEKSILKDPEYEQYLDFSKLSLKKTDAITYTLTFQSKEPKMLLPVINASLNNLETLCYRLNIVSFRDIIMVLDQAKKPKRPLPRKSMEKVFKVIALSFFFSIVLVFIINFFNKHWTEIKKIKIN